MVLGKAEWEGNRVGQKWQIACQVARFWFSHQPPPWALEFSEPHLAHLLSGDDICLPFLGVCACPVGSSPSGFCSLFFAICLPISLIADELLENRDTGANISISQHMLGKCLLTGWMDE